MIGLSPLHLPHAYQHLMCVAPWKSSLSQRNFSSGKDASKKMEMFSDVDEINSSNVMAIHSKR